MKCIQKNKHYPENTTFQDIFLMFVVLVMWLQFGQNLTWLSSELKVGM